MKRRILIGLLCIILIISSAILFSACAGNSVKTTVIDMSLEDAKAKVAKAGGIPVVADVYDAEKDDGALLSIGKFAANVSEGDFVTILRNDLGLKDRITALPVAPSIIEQSSFEKKIYSKICEDKTLKMNFDTYYTLITPETATDAQKNAYPIVKDMAIYVLDTSASENERSKLAKHITENTEYTAEDMFDDYVKVGIVPTPCENMIAKLADPAALSTEEVDGGLAITGFKGELQNVVIPAEIDGKPVIQLSKGAFPQSTIHSVTLLDGVETIGTEAFSAAYGIVNIYLPDSVASVQENAFPAALLTNMAEDGIVYLGSEQDLAVSYVGVDSVLEVPKGVRFIGGGFARNNRTLFSVTLPDGLISIGVEAFRQCELLAACNIPDTVTRICEGAFRTTRHLTVIDIPDSVTRIDDYAFFETNDVISITIGENVKTIGNEAFVYNLLVTDVHIPDSVEYIGAGAFQKCLVLNEVTGASNVSYVGSQAFLHDPWYTDLCLKSRSSFGFLNDKENILILYDGREAEVTLPDTVTCLSSAFQNVTVVKKIIVNDGCEIITSQAFAACNGLKDVVIPASVTTIEEDAFEDITDRVTIHCEAGSYAEEYAKENFIAYDNDID